MNIMPTAERLLALFEYNAETGVLTRKRTGNTVTTRNVKIGRKEQYLKHRVIWVMMTGKDPGEICIDHIDRDPSNNRWINLRLATHQENMQNYSCKGVTYDKRRNKWRAQIQHEGRKQHIGYCDCPLLARMMYMEKSRELRGEYSPV